MHRIAVAVLLPVLCACGRLATPRHGYAKEFDEFLTGHAQGLLPELDRNSGGGGGGGSDGAYSSQFDRRIETTKAIPADRHAALIADLAKAAREWLDEHHLEIRARGTTGDENETLERVCYRYEAGGLVGWLALDGIRNEDGGFTLLITIMEHVG